MSVCVRTHSHTHTLAHAQTGHNRNCLVNLQAASSPRINLSFSGPYVYEKQSISHSERITHFQFSLLTFEPRGEVAVCLRSCVALFVCRRHLPSPNPACSFWLCLLALHFAFSQSLFFCRIISLFAMLTKKKKECRG